MYVLQGARIKALDHKTVSQILGKKKGDAFVTEFLVIRPQLAFSLAGF